MKPILVCIIAAVTLIGCGTVSQKAEEAAAEQIAGKLLGQNIDTDNYNDIGSNSATVDLKIDGERIFAEDMLFKGMVNAYEDNFVIQVNDDNHKGRILMSLEGAEVYSEKPLSGYTKPGETEDNIITGTLMLSKSISENEAVSYLFHEGEIDVKGISKDKVVVKLSGTVGDIMSVTKGENLKEISGTITLNKPTMTGIGVELENIIY